MKKRALLVTVIAVLSLGLAGPVLAAAPGNDTYAGRISIPGLPYSTTVDTTEATTDADDADANATCGAPATDASVWFELTAAADGAVYAQAYDSDYSVGLLVATGAPGSWTVLYCSPFEAWFSVLAGETYTILAFDFQGDEGGNGGTLNLVVDEVPPPPTLEISIDPTGRFDAATGAATITGTVTCTGGDGFDKSGMEILASQAVGRFRINGQGGGSFSCDGSAQPWAVEVWSSDGKFAGGKATVSLFAFSCSSGGCTDVQVEAKVTLRR